MKRFFPIILLLIFVNACAPDPRKEAEAYATRIEAEQKAANEIQNRQHAQQLHEFQLQSLAMNQENQKAFQQQWQLAVNRAIWVGSLTLIAVVCYSMISVSKTINRTVEGIGVAFVRRADVSANLIQLDRVTRQYPAFLQYIGNGRFVGVNFNTNSVLVLDTRSEPDRQMIAQMGAVQYAGALAQEARQSNDPAGISIIQPPIIDVKSEMISLGKDVVRRSNE